MRVCVIAVLQARWSVAYSQFCLPLHYLQRQMGVHDLNLYFFGRAGMKWFTIFYSIVSTVSMVEALRHVGSYPFRMWNLRADARVGVLTVLTSCCRGSVRSTDKYKYTTRTAMSVGL